MADHLSAVIDGITFVATRHRPQCPENGLTLFCLPGGGVTKDLFNLAPKHSFIDRMTSKGYSIITMDHPGTATNPLPNDHKFLKPRKAADYIGKALTHWLDNTLVIGIGHSMGGMTITLINAIHRPFKAIGLFGSNAGGLDWGLSDEERKYNDRPLEFERDIEKLTIGKFGADFIQYPNQGPSGKSITFGGETGELTQRLREISCSLYAAGGMMSMTRGSFQKEVLAIEVPLFFAFGDHDIGMPPEEAPKDYVNAPNTELVILPKTGHNHFAFNSIELLCKRLDHWASNLD